LGKLNDWLLKKFPPQPSTCSLNDALTAMAEAPNGIAGKTGKQYVSAFVSALRSSF
jgi:hypothetical protein